MALSGIFTDTSAPGWCPIKFAVYRNSAANTGNGAFAALVFDTILFDTSNNFSTSTGIFTAPVGGFYQFNFNAGQTTGSVFAASLYLNGAEYLRVEDAAATGNTRMAGSVLIKLALNDTMAVQVFGNAANALNVGAADTCRFSGFLVSYY